MHTLESHRVYIHGINKSHFSPTCFSPIGPSSGSTMCLAFEVANQLQKQGTLYSLKMVQ